MYSREEIEAAGLHVFRNFLRETWSHLLLPPPTPVQNDIADILQYGEQRICIEAFRGVGKTFITSTFAAWNLLQDPDFKVLIVSAGQSHSDNIAIFIKKLIELMPILQHLRPKPDQRYANVAFDVGPARPDVTPSVRSLGITGQLTGGRANLIIPDDIETPKNSYTHLMRERLAELVKEFDAVLKPGGRICYLGTPQIEQSLYNRLPERGYRIYIWPAEVPANPDKYHGKLGPLAQRVVDKGIPPGTPMDPKRFDRNELGDRRASWGLSGYALQYMLDTTPSDQEKHPLKCADLLVTDLDSEQANVKYVWTRDRESLLQDLQSGGYDGDAYYRPSWKSAEMVPYQGTVMAIDPSGRGNDETGYSIVSYCYGQLFLRANGGFRDGYSEETLRALAKIAVRYRVNDLVTEQNYGGGMFDQLLVPYLQQAAQQANLKEKEEGGAERWWSPRVNDPDRWNGWSRGQKELRILEVLEPVVQSHRLIVDRRVIEDDLKVQADTPRYSLIYQLTRLTRDRGALANEDRLESLSMGCEFWKALMDRDRDKAIHKEREAALMKELSRFKQYAINPIGPGKTRSLRYAGRR